MPLEILPTPTPKLLAVAVVCLMPGKPVVIARGCRFGLGVVRLGKGHPRVQGYLSYLGFRV